MKTLSISNVKEAEDQLLSALLKSNLEAINELLHDDLIFIIPTGQIITKAMDLENYKTGSMKVHSLEVSDQEISLFQDTAVVAVVVNLKGTFMDQPIDGTYRYLRYWKDFDNTLKVIGGASIQLDPIIE